MKRNMNHWFESTINDVTKKSIPVLSFPGMRLIDANVNELVHSGELQAKCMKAIAQRYDTGAALSLMDLSVEAEAFGSPIRFSEYDVPTVTAAILNEPQDIVSLRTPVVGDGRTDECVKGVELACKMITDRPVFASVIGPFSLAGRLMDMTNIMIMALEDPEFVEATLEKVTAFITTYILALKAAGANGVVMAEPAAGLLSPKLNRDFSIRYVDRVRRAVEDENFLMIYHNCGHVLPQLADVAASGVRAFHLGNAINLKRALEILPGGVIVMGNIDPVMIRNGTPEMVEDATYSLMQVCGRYPNFIVSSGCDIPPMTDFKNIDAFFETVNRCNEGAYRKLYTMIA